MKRLLSFVFMLTFSIGSFSQINSSETALNEDKSANMYTIRHNSVYCEDLLMFSYQRLFPVEEKLALSLKGGFMIWDPLLPMLETGFVTGGPKSFFEAGIGTIFDPFYGGGFFTLLAGYRYQASKGFLFRFSAIYSPDNFILPLLGIGYAF